MCTIWHPGKKIYLDCTNRLMWKWISFGKSPFATSASVCGILMGYPTVTSYMASICNAHANQSQSLRLRYVLWVVHVCYVYVFNITCKNIRYTIVQCSGPTNLFLFFGLDRDLNLHAEVQTVKQNFWRAARQLRNRLYVYSLAIDLLTALSSKRTTREMIHTKHMKHYCIHTPTDVIQEITLLTSIRQ